MRILTSLHLQISAQDFVSAFKSTPIDSGCREVPEGRQTLSTDTSSRGYVCFLPPTTRELFEDGVPAVPVLALLPSCLPTEVTCILWGTERHLTWCCQRMWTIKQCHCPKTEGRCTRHVPWSPTKEAPHHKHIWAGSAGGPQ